MYRTMSEAAAGAPLGAFGCETGRGLGPYAGCAIPNSSTGGSAPDARVCSIQVDRVEYGPGRTQITGTRPVDLEKNTASAEETSVL